MCPDPWRETETGGTSDALDADNDDEEEDDELEVGRAIDSCSAKMISLD